MLLAVELDTLEKRKSIIAGVGLSNGELIDWSMEK